jgi:ribosomal protein S18 acetylase RimI-like enzyme
MNITPATSADLPALVELWNAAFGPDWPMTARLLRQTIADDPFYEPAGSLIAREGKRVAGWVLSKTMRDAGPEMGRFQRRGGLGAICVHPDFQRQGLATRLLDRAEAHLHKYQSPKTLLYYPHHLLPGIPLECEAAILMFRQRGYTITGECVDLQRGLAEYSVPDKARAALEANPAVQMRPAQAGEAGAVIAFVEREFPGGWPYSTRLHFASGGRASDIIVAVENGALIGFCHTADWSSVRLLPSTYWHPLLGDLYGGLGPIGIAKEHRKRGLGLALLAVAVDDLKRRGVTQMAIDWTNLIDFYEKLGFSVWKRYLQAEKR